MWEFQKKEFQKKELFLAQLQIMKSKSSFISIGELNYEITKASKILNETDFNKMPLDFKHKIFVKYILDANIWKKNVTFTSGKLNNGTDGLIAKYNIQTCNEFKKYMRDIYFSEEMSDECLIQLIRSSIITPNNCHISKLCSSYMVDNNYYIPSYGITHRLLFLQISEALKCNWNKKWLDVKTREYCTYIFWEAQKNSDCGFFAELDDLLLEQILLCGYEGFIEFMPRKWMEYVLSIQNEYDCFGIFNTTYYAPRDELKKRRKREANIIKFGCMDHTTGLAAGVLSLFLRFLVENREQI